MLQCGVRIECGELLLRLLAIGLSNGAIIALNAIGVTLVYGVVRMINFAHGDLFALITAVVAGLIAALGVQPESGPLALLGSFALTLLLASASGALVNGAVERVAFRPFRGGSRVAPLIATIGISFIFYQGALFLRYATNRYIPGEHRSVPGLPEYPRLRIPDLLPQFDLVQLTGLRLQVAFPLRDLLVALLAVGLALLTEWFLRRTRTGRALQACSQDPQMARMCGVDPDAAIRLTFVIGGALAGVAAWIFTLYYTHPFTLYGAQSGLVAFTAAVLGGVGRPMGALVSGLLLGLLAAFSDYFLATQWTPVLLLGVLMLLLLLRPGGLAGEADVDSVNGAPDAIAVERTPASKRSWWLAAGLLGLALYPLLDSALGWYELSKLLSVLIFALLALGLTLVLGFAGLLDLGFAACFAVGAYAAGILTTAGGPFRALGAPPLDFTLVLAISGAVAALFGVLNAAVTLRLRGEYLAIVTLAFGQIVPQIILNLDRWTGGRRGISGLPPPTLLGQPLTTVPARYYLALGLLLLGALACTRLRDSRLGRAWAALSADEAAAASCGISVARSRMLVFALGAGVAGLAGALFASSFSYVDPGQSEFRISAMVLAMVVIGGAGSVRGAIIGALIVAGADQLLIPLLGAWTQRLAEQSGLWWLVVLDVRGINYLAFGLALYLATLLRARKPAKPVASSSPVRAPEGVGSGAR